MNDVLSNPYDHHLWSLLRNRAQAEPPVSMTVIADELGVTVDELCQWIFAYRGRKGSTKPYLSRNELPDYVATPRTSERAAARFAAWKRQHDGAKKQMVKEGLTSRGEQ